MVVSTMEQEMHGKSAIADSAFFFVESNKPFNLY